MRQFSKVALAETSIYAGSGLVDALIVGFPGWGWGVIAAASLGVLIGMYWQDAERRFKRAQKRTDFDMPIREAVNHLVSTVPHSFDSADKAERFFFDRLYTLMCEGKLPVIGARVEGDRPRRLKRRQCRRYKPIAINVPRSPTSPDGVRFDLLDRKVESLSLVEWKSFPGFTGLRVRSANLYGMYPQNRASEGGE